MKKTIRTTFIVLLALVALPFLVALFVPKSYGIKSEVVIKKNQQAVFGFVKYLKNQQQYSVWSRIDTTMRIYELGTDAQPGYVSGWESTNPEVGSGEQEIKAIHAPHRIEYELRFFEPMQTTDQAYLQLTAIDSMQTRVEWGFQGRLSYPTNLIRLFMNLEEMLQNDFDQGLANLKQILEN